MWSRFLVIMAVCARALCTRCSLLRLDEELPYSIEMSLWRTYIVDHFSFFTVPIRYDTRCYFNVRSKADMSQLNLPHQSRIRLKTVPMQQSWWKRLWNLIAAHLCVSWRCRRCTLTTPASVDASSWVELYLCGQCARSLPQDASLHKLNSSSADDQSPARRRGVEDTPTWEWHQIMPTLKCRRYCGDMIEVFKINKGIYYPTCVRHLDLVKFSDDVIRTTGTKYKLIQHHCCYDLRKFNCTNRVIPITVKPCSLSNHVVSADTVRPNCFENRLDKLWITFIRKS